MPKKNVEELEEGMVLAEDIKGSQGNLLLTAGVSLTDKHIRVMKTWGISMVEIEGEEEVAYTPEQFEQAKAQTTQMFMHNDLKHPLYAILFEESTKLRANLIASGVITDKAGTKGEDEDGS